MTGRNTRADVIYIGGASRSGSTLIAEALGAQPGVFNGGELALFWRDAARGNHCACGERLTECALWGRALNEVQDQTGIGADDYKMLASVRANLSHTTRPQRLYAMLRDRACWTREERALVESSTVLLNAVKRLADADVVVDASKTLPGMLFHRLMNSSRIGLLHLIRDPRAVAASTLRSRDVQRGNEASLPPGSGLPVAIARWCWANSTTLATSRFRMVSPTVTLRYEDFVEHPDALLYHVCHRFDVPFEPSTLNGRVLHLPHQSHAAVGNPRRGSQTTPIVLDDRWQTELSTTQQHIVRAITWPLYGTMGSTNRSLRGWYGTS